VRPARGVARARLHRGEGGGIRGEERAFVPLDRGNSAGGYIAVLESRIRREEAALIDEGEIRRRVAEALPGSEISIRDMVGDRDHYEMTVVSTAFVGKSTLQRHRMVYAPLKELLGGQLHALALRTLAPGEPA